MTDGEEKLWIVLKDVLKELQATRKVLENATKHESGISGNFWTDGEGFIRSGAKPMVEESQ